ncbi:hypothetical protein ANRL2_02893 [Anaerolineae bacterium]|nr:hypothetical protein ANRL2_02893 [Anaerolineae bacterium]
MKAVAILALLALALLFGAGAWQMRRIAPGEQSALAKQVVRATAPRAPEIASATWLNSAPLTARDLRGKVVVVEFWTFG